MATTVPARKFSATLVGYAALRRRVQRTLLHAQQQIEAAKIHAYWDTGRDINDHIKLHGGRAEYGEKVILRLAGHIKLHPSILQRCSELAKAFPKKMVEKLIDASWQQSPSSPYKTSKNVQSAGLVWSHFRALIPVVDNEIRYRLARRALRYGWTVEELEAKVKNFAASPAGSLTATKQIGSGKRSRRSSETQSKSALLTPKRGELLTYQIVRDQNVLALDHGFAKYWNLSLEEAKLFSEGDIVRKLPDGKMEKLTKGTKSLLYTYEADVIRVVDGDTIWMKIYLEGRGNPPWVKEKLRLRDIDAPELNTPEGKAAKKFVEDWLAKAKRILITTTKPDKWDRYLTDVFIETASGNEIYLNNALLEAGHARVKTDWSLDDWEA